MATINSYENDSVINAADKVIGSDGAVGVDQGKTKNFSVSSLTTYVSAQTLSHPIIITGLIDASSDSDAEDNGVPVGGVYQNSGTLFIRNT
tara:strand:+ start:171 stop:443 length:273 start_codon:yes stop_codon:yes gene_type:complete